MISILSAIAVFFCDQKVKKQVETGEIKDGERFFKDYVTIQKSYNKGFVLNQFEESPKWVLVISSAVFGVLAFLFTLTLGKKHRKIKRFGLALALGGAASNLYDRIRQDQVTDFAVIKGIKDIIVNIGDVFIVLGTFIAFIGEVIGRDS